MIFGGGPGGTEARNRRGVAEVAAVAAFLGAAVGAEGPGAATTTEV
jgi:hypothetical protein